METLTTTLVDELKEIINCPIYLDKEGRESVEFEALFDDYEKGLCVEVKGFVSWKDLREYETNSYQIDFYPDYDEVIFYKDDEEVQLSESEKREVLTKITFE